MDIFSEQTLAGRLSFARSMCPLCGFVRSLLSQSYDGLEIYPVFAVLVMPGDVSICLYQCDWCLKNSDKSPNPVFNANVYRILWPPEQIPQPSQPNQTNYSTVWFSLFWRFCPVQQRDCFFRFVRRGKNYRGGAFSLGGVDKMSAKLTVLLFVCGSWCFSQVYIYIYIICIHIWIYMIHTYIFLLQDISQQKLRSLMKLLGIKCKVGVVFWLIYKPGRSIVKQLLESWWVAFTLEVYSGWYVYKSSRLTITIWRNSLQTKTKTTTQVYIL